MATDAATFPIAREGRRDKSINPVNPGLQNKGNDNHGEPMTKAEREELAELKELVHQQIALASLNARSQPQIQVQTATPITKWLLASLAIFTFLGGAGSFIGNSGVWVGNRNRDADEMREMKSRLDNLRTLYLIRFGEDPDKVTPENMNRRLQSSQEKK